MKRPNLRPRALLVGFLAASMLVAGASWVAPHSPGPPTASRSSRGGPPPPRSRPSSTSSIPTTNVTPGWTSPTPPSPEGPGPMPRWSSLPGSLPGHPRRVADPVGGQHRRLGAHRRRPTCPGLHTDDVKDALPDSVLSAMTVKGHQYGVPTSAHRPNVLMYNAERPGEGGGPGTGRGLHTLTQFLADVATVKGSGATALCLGAEGLLHHRHPLRVPAPGPRGSDGMDRDREGPLRLERRGRARGARLILHPCSTRRPPSSSRPGTRPPPPWPPVRARSRP